MKKTREEERLLQNNKLWKEFVDSGKFSKGLKAEDISDQNFDTSLFQCASYKADILILRKYLSADGYHRFDLRFRAFKYRSKSDVTTISVSNATKEKLKAISKKSGFTDINYDFILEMLMSSENELESTLKDIEIESLPTSLNQNSQSVFLRQKLRLRGPTWRIILSQMDYAFNSGWHACKYLKEKRRTDAVLLEEAQTFMDKIKGLI